MLLRPGSHPSRSGGADLERRTLELTQDPRELPVLPAGAGVHLGWARWPRRRAVAGVVLAGGGNTRVNHIRQAHTTTELNSVPQKQHQEQLAEQKKSIANLEKKIFEKFEQYLKGSPSGQNISLSSRSREVDGENMPND